MRCGPLTPSAARGPAKTQVEQDSFRQAFQTELQLRLDGPANLLPTAVNPLVGPPLYGRWYAGRDKLPLPGDGDIEAERPVWFRELNLDARERAAAGFGTRVIQREQEQLMHMAWRQIGDIKEANRLLVRTQFAREVNNSLYNRHFKRMKLGWLLAITWRLHWRIFINGESLSSLFERCSNWGLRCAIFSPWAVRFYRPGGPIGGPWGGPIDGDPSQTDRPRHLPDLIDDGGPDSGADDVLDPEPPGLIDGCVCDLIYNRGTALGSPPNCPSPPDTGSAGDSLFGGLPIGDLTSGGEAIASHQDWPLEDADKLFDNNPSTRWRAPLSKSPWVKYKLAGSQHRVVTSYSVTSANDHPDRDPKAWTFEGSHTGLSWTVLDTQANVTFATRLEEKTFAFANAIAYSHYRLNISNNQGSLHTQLAELQFFEDPAVYDDLTEGGTAAASSAVLLFGPDKLFDDNAGTKWIADASAAWVRYSFAAGREHIVTSYALVSADDDSLRDPKDWTLEGSHNGTTWVVLDTRTGVNFAHRYEKKTFSIPNTTGFAHYRLNISHNHGSSRSSSPSCTCSASSVTSGPCATRTRSRAWGCRPPTGDEIDEIPPNDDYEFPAVGGGPGATGEDSPDAAAARDAARQDAGYVVFIDTIRAHQNAQRTCTLSGEEIRGAILQFLDPEVTSVSRARARLEFDEEAWDPVDPLHWIMAHPKIDKPMYESLPDHDLLPGLDKIQPDTITLLRTNPRFIEAFMVGLNHEFGREMLWREYPTDQRGTVFRQFWDVAGRHPALARPEDGYDIPEIVGWNPTFPMGKTIETYGANSMELDPEDEGQVVLLIRGELLRRYPTAEIYAVAGQWYVDAQGHDRRRPSGPPVQPIFRGTLDPDVTFFGFNLSVREAKGTDDPSLGDPGYFFAIQQQPFEPRFGLDVANYTLPVLPPLADPDTENGNPWNALSWRHLAPNSEATLATITHINVATPLARARDDLPRRHHVTHLGPELFQHGRDHLAVAGADPDPRRGHTVGARRGMR